MKYQIGDVVWANDSRLKITIIGKIVDISMSAPKNENDFIYRVEKPSDSSTPFRPYDSYYDDTVILLKDNKLLSILFGVEND